MVGAPKQVPEALAAAQCAHARAESKRVSSFPALAIKSTDSAWPNNIGTTCCVFRTFVGHLQGTHAMSGFKNGHRKSHDATMAFL